MNINFIRSQTHVHYIRIFQIKLKSSPGDLGFISYIFALAWLNYFAQHWKCTNRLGGKTFLENVDFPITLRIYMFVYRMASTNYGGIISENISR